MDDSAPSLSKAASSSDDESDGDIAFVDFPAQPLMEVPNTNMLNNSLRSSYKKTAPVASAVAEPVTVPVARSASPAPPPSKVDSALATSDNGKPLTGAMKRRLNRKRPREGASAGAPNPDDKDDIESAIKAKLVNRQKARPSIRYADLGGIEDILQDVRELIERPLLHPELYQWLGVESPRGVLLHGPPGCGKTHLAMAIAGELGVPFFQIAAPEVVSGMSGESEAKLRSLFQEAAGAAPSLIFIDEIDAITPKRETAAREMERRIVAQLLTCMDELTSENTNGRAVIVVGATNRPDSLDPALRRAGRFDREIPLGVPDEAARVRILQVLSRKLRLDGDFDFLRIARETPGFVGADLQALTAEAASIAVNRIFSELEHEPLAASSSGNLEDADAMETDDAPQRVLADTPTMVHTTEYKTQQKLKELERRLAVSTKLREMSEPFTEAQMQGLAIAMEDFVQAMKKVQPSSKREGFATIPNVSWSDIGALGEVQRELRMALLEPIRYKTKFEAMGVHSAQGVLLFGPPGCGKTLLAKAVANEAQASFISIKGPELLNKYVGESERAVRTVFQRYGSFFILFSFSSRTPEFLGLWCNGLCSLHQLGQKARQGARFFRFGVVVPSFMHNFLSLTLPAFRRARASAPCIIFFDELDALAPRRAGGENAVGERVVNQLLIELDGLETRRDVFVIAATNRPDMIDSAMLRPGRLDKHLYVPLPDLNSRTSILQTAARRTPLTDVDFGKVASDPRCSGYSGADLAQLVREASMEALQESFDRKDTDDVIPSVTMRHFHAALNKVNPSVSKADEARYNALKKKLFSPRLRIDTDGNPLPPPSLDSV